MNATDDARRLKHESHFETLVTPWTDADEAGDIAYNAVWATKACNLGFVSGKGAEFYKLVDERVRIETDSKNKAQKNGSIAAARQRAKAKIGSHASSNGLPYKDGVPSKNPVLKFFGDAELGIARGRLTRTGRIQSYEWSKLQPAYDKLGQVFEEHPIILLEPRRIANMDEVRPQLSPPMIVAVPGNPNLYKDYTGR